MSSNLESWAALKEEIFQQIRTVSKEALTGKLCCWVLAGSEFENSNLGLNNTSASAQRGVLLEKKIV